jgi:predicted alpha-1,2-mannosidase
LSLSGLALGLLVVVAAPPVAAAETPADLVDPFIGTGAHGHTYPGATLPFGMVQLSPDTRLEGWDGCSGYHYTDHVVYGFSHTHLSGTGIGDYGDVLFMPVTGEPNLDNGYGTGPDEGYASRFDKKTERAGAGWYEVELADYGIQVELTATERAGLHRYVFPEGRQAHVVVDLLHRDRVLESTLRVVSDREIEGTRRSTGWADDQIVHFVARFSRPFEDAFVALDDRSLEDAREASGTNVKGIFSFGDGDGDGDGDGGGELRVSVGISAVGIDGARKNLDAELPGDPDFDTVRSAARNRWNEALGRIEVEGGTDAQRRIFYTALYHSLLAPNLYSDVDGRYRGMDHQIHRAEDRRHYTVFSLWDTFRATHPLYTLIEPERTREFIETFLAMYRQGGRLPVWELAANETDTMIGYHSISVLVDAWVKGIRGFDEGLALDAMVDSATRDHFGLEAYKRQGFIGSEDDGESVSKTLEYAYDDWCIARMADEMGRDETAAEFYRRSQGWKHLLDPETGFMRPRRNQCWLDPFDPRRVDNNFTEANSWQYSFFVPHDVEGLIGALGGNERFVERLDALFTADSATTGRTQADITGLIGQYAHGNEPSHHMAWLYHYAGRPDRSAERVAEILDTLYAASPEGLSGNEDCGQMSSWYVFGAMGFYPVCPCSDDYVLAPPLFDRVTMRLADDREFTIRARGQGSGPRYIQSVSLNGEGLDRSYMRHEEIARGGELVLTLASEPGAEWGRSAEGRPRSRVDAEPVIPAPFLVSEAELFRDSLTVELGCADTRAAIRYTVDPEAPEPSWKTYEQPIVITESTRLRFVAERGGRRSPVVESYLHRIPNEWTIDVRSIPNPQYTAGGPAALIDGLRGDPNWRTGGWQGYQYTDFEATVDLGGPRPVSRVGASFLQDAKSWIWMPAEVVVSVSSDGREFREVARLAHDVSDDAEGIHLRDLVADVTVVEARYVRVLARSYGTIPDWHPGRGDGAFIFIDEILID